MSAPAHATLLQGGIHAMQGNPTGCMGLANYPAGDGNRKLDSPLSTFPVAPSSLDNFMETILISLSVPGHSTPPIIPLDEQLHPKWLFSAAVHDERGCDQAALSGEATLRPIIIRRNAWSKSVFGAQSSTATSLSAAG